MRLDSLLVERSLAETRSKATGLIMSGSVFVNGRIITKSGTAVDSEAEITLKETMPYVSRAGVKLSDALDRFNVDVTDMVAIDIGSSTGGFTDVLLSRGVERVYAVDVGHGQLHWKLRNHDKVVILEGLNARFIDSSHVPEHCDIATFDVSFISLKLVVPQVLNLMKRPSALIALIKPQFEAGRGQIGKGGIVRDPAVIEGVLEDMRSFFAATDLSVSGIIPSPIKGAKGNQEYLIHAVCGAMS